MKNILMLGTGGTIASVPSADGLIPALDGSAMLQLVPELEGICTITCKSTSPMLVPSKNPTTLRIFW